jgi:hypothetical protein
MRMQAAASGAARHSQPLLTLCLTVGRFPAIDAAQHSDRARVSGTTTLLHGSLTIKLVNAHWSTSRI